MRGIFTLTFLLIILSSFSIDRNTSLNNSIPIDPGPKSSVAIKKSAPLKLKEIEKLLGRKLTLKEKIAFKIATYKLKKSLHSKENSSKGKTAFILSLIGICLLIVPFGILASIPLAIIGLVMGSQAKKEDPGDRKAQTAIILSLVTLGLIVLALILVIAVLASWGGAWY